VQDVEIRHGILQLDSKNTTLLGGEVAELNEKPRIEAIMFQMQERLGYAFDQEPHSIVHRRHPWIFA